LRNNGTTLKSIFSSLLKILVINYKNCELQEQKHKAFNLFTAMTYYNRTAHRMPVLLCTNCIPAWAHMFILKQNLTSRYSFFLSSALIFAVPKMFPLLQQFQSDEEEKKSILVVEFNARSRKCI